MIETIDHFVLTTGDLEKCLHFYVDILGMDHVVSTEGQHCLHFGSHKINLHTRPGEFQPAATNISPGSCDFCLITKDMDSLKAIRNRYIAEGIEIIDDMSTQIGARGELCSVYVYDPDGNLVEVATYM